MKIFILLPRSSNTSVVRLCKELCVSLSEINYDSDNATDSAIVIDTDGTSTVEYLSGT